MDVFFLFSSAVKCDMWFPKIGKYSLGLHFLCALFGEDHTISCSSLCFVFSADEKMTCLTEIF